MVLVRMFDTESLEGAQIIAIAEFLKQFFLDRPIPVATFRAKFPLDVALEIVLNAVVLQQRIIHVTRKTIWSGWLMDLFHNVMVVVPQPDDRSRQIMFVAERAQAGSVQHEMAAGRFGGRADPARRQHANEMAAGKHQCRAIKPAQADG